MKTKTLRSWKSVSSSRTRPRYSRCQIKVTFAFREGRRDFPAKTAKRSCAITAIESYITYSICVALFFSGIRKSDYKLLMLNTLPQIKNTSLSVTLLVYLLQSEITRGDHRLAAAYSGYRLWTAFFFFGFSRRGEGVVSLLGLIGFSLGLGDNLFAWFPIKRVTSSTVCQIYFTQVFTSQLESSTALTTNYEEGMKN